MPTILFNWPVLRSKLNRRFYARLRRIAPMQAHVEIKARYARFNPPS